MHYDLDGSAARDGNGPTRGDEPVGHDAIDPREICEHAPGLEDEARGAQRAQGTLAKARHGAGPTEGPRVGQLDQGEGTAV